MKLFFILLILINLQLIRLEFNFGFETTEIHILDVGQGDSILIKTPGGKFGLIDTGSASNLIEELSDVLPPLMRNLEFVLLTHFDSDHIEGLIELSRRFDISKVIVTRDYKDNDLISRIKNLIYQNDIPDFVIYDDTDFYLENIFFNTLWPLKNFSEEIKSSNDKSIAFAIEIGGCRLFSSGDLSSEYELMAIRNYDLERFNILKVSHHGSQTSTSEEFVKLVNSQVAIISSGKNNRFGHPSSEVLERLGGQDVYRTDQLGRIKIEFIQSSFKINDSKTYSCKH